MTKRRRAGRRYPVPANYPVEASVIPDMPVETFHLLTTGHVLAAERETYGFVPMMACGTCAAPVDLIYRHASITPATIAAAMTPRKGHTVPSTMWDRDVLVICRCCSFAKCQHCMCKGELILGHQFNEHGRCTRCGHASQVTNVQLAHRLQELDATISKAEAAV